MSIVSDAIVGGIAWEAFSKSVAFYAEKVNDFALRVYINQQLKAIETLEGASENQIEEVLDAIEATIVEVPEEIKNLTDKEEQQERFLDYFNKRFKTRSITAGNYYEKIVVKGDATFGGGSVPK
jgi:replicative DNA helicase